MDAEGFIGIRSLRYLAHWCDVVVLSQRVQNFVESGLGTGAKRHVFRCTNETRDYGPCQSRVKAFGFQEEFWFFEEGPLFAAADLLRAALCRAQVLKPRPNPAMHHGADFWRR